MAARMLSSLRPALSSAGGGVTAAAATASEMPGLVTAIEMLEAVAGACKGGVDAGMLRGRRRRGRRGRWAL